MATTQSTTGYFRSEYEHVRYDEATPHCPPCQKSEMESSAHTSITHPNTLNQKPPTLPAPRTEVGTSQVTAHLGISLTDTGALDHEWVTPKASRNTPGSSTVVSFEIPSEHMDISNRRALSSSLSESLQGSSVELKISYGSAGGTTNPTDRISTLPDISEAVSMVADPVRPLGALFTLDQLLAVMPHSYCPLPTADRSGLLTACQSPVHTEGQDDVTPTDDEDSDGVVTVIRRQPMLDKTAESNALPFVLQGYTNWINRLAFDPLKLTGVAREFVYSQFEAGEQSRWIVALLANTGSMIGSVQLVEGKQTPMLCALQTAMRRRLAVIKSRPNPKRSELVKALHSATETMVVQFYASPISEAMTLRREAAPIFRQLCLEPLDAPINLPSLLQHPVSYLWRYAEIDIICSVVADIPMLFPYDVGILGGSPSYLSPSVSTIQSDGVVQWFRGIPNQLVFLFAHMKTIREDGFTPNEETVVFLEQEIRKLRPFDGSSSDRFLAIMRSVVQECWRQAAFVYLYMAVCGDAPDTPRVREAFKRYMKLLNSTKPGRLPDEFLVFGFILISAAAQRQRDREVIRQRALRLYTYGLTQIASSWIILVIDDIWARADAEQRLVMWSDVGVSGKKFLGV